MNVRNEKNLNQRAQDNSPTKKIPISKLLVTLVSQISEMGIAN